MNTVLQRRHRMTRRSLNHDMTRKPKRGTEDSRRRATQPPPLPHLTTHIDWMRLRGLRERYIQDRRFTIRRVARQLQADGEGNEGTRGMKIRCHPCGEWMEVDTMQELEDHIRVIHPDLFTPLERWPDGQVVVHDETLVDERGEVKLVTNDDVLKLLEAYLAENGYTVADYLETGMELADVAADRNLPWRD